MNTYYIYYHYMPNSNIPFYIGKGKKNRAYQTHNRNLHWYNIVKKYGSPRIEFEFENISNETASQMEIDNIKMWGRADLGLGPLVNMTNGGEGICGRICSEETRCKQSVAMKGVKRKPLSEKHRSNISLATKGKKHKPFSEEHKFNISLSKKGTRHSEKWKRNQSLRMVGNTYNKGKFHSNETKRKISISEMGKKLSDETKLKMSIAAMGRKHEPMSEETKKKISLAHKGKKHGPMSEETKKKISISNIGRKGQYIKPLLEKTT